MLNGFIVFATVLAGGILLLPKVANCRIWRAAITPLASIIGSGFLVLGPILYGSFGLYAPAIMAVLCAVAWCFGAAIRTNILALADSTRTRGAVQNRLETVASWALAFAYIISTAYYLNLLGAFAVSMTTLDEPVNARLITSGVFVIILIVGWTRGFHALERMEQISVGLKLSIIAGLLVGLGWYFVEKLATAELFANPATVGGWQAAALTAGLLVTVQGFETSRYLGDEYDAQTRVRSMRLAQWISAAIYMLYILLLSYVFAPAALALSETAIIDLMGVVAPILPLLLITAAISAQFSAAVADTGGSGGLLHELTGGRISLRAGYLVLVVTGLALTWTMSVFEIISYASRAFALYYAIQAFLAARSLQTAGHNRCKAAAFAGLGLLGLAITLFGAPVE